jgi:hypothetical protein
MDKKGKIVKKPVLKKYKKPVVRKAPAKKEVKIRDEDELIDKLDELDLNENPDIKVEKSKIEPDPDDLDNNPWDDLPGDELLDLVDDMLGLEDKKPEIKKPEIKKPEIKKPNEKPKVEKPKAKDPNEKLKVEKPKVEKPKVEEPKAEEPEEDRIGNDLEDLEDLDEDEDEELNDHKKPLTNAKKPLTKAEEQRGFDDLDDSDDIPDKDPKKDAKDMQEELEKELKEFQRNAKKEPPKNELPKKEEPLKNELPKKEEVKKIEVKKDEPKKDEPLKKEEPKKDEPKKDEPLKKEEPKKDEPKKEEAKDIQLPLIETKGDKWIDPVREMIYDHGVKHHDRHLITDKHEKMKSPENLDLTLLPHQKAVVKAMYDIENKRYVNVKLQEYAGDQGTKFIIETCAAILSDKPGSGKTYDILGLLCVSPVPKPVCDISSYPPTKGINVTTGRYNDARYYPNFSVTEVRRKYTKNLPLNLIFVSKSVIYQWEEAIRNTNLKFLTIKNVFDLVEFCNMFFRPTKTKNINTLKNYNIVLIKNSRVTKNFHFPGLESYTNGATSKSILAIFGSLFKDYCFARVILDDFDILNIPHQAYPPPNKFMWAVSATQKFEKSSCVYPFQNSTMLEDITQYRAPYSSIWKNDALLNIFNVKCVNEFVDTSISLGVVNVIAYKFVNNNEQFVDMLRVMGTDDARHIMEALNGDAIKAASQEVGSSDVLSVSRIFEKVLDKKYKNWKHNHDIEKYITGVSKYISKLPGYVLDYKLTATILNNFRVNLNRPGPASQIKKEILITNSDITEVLDEVNSKNKAEKEENGRAINRVRDNLKEGECPIMCTPLKDSQIIILTCCGVAVSQEGAEIGLKLKSDGVNHIGICPNCRANLTRANLLFIDKKMNLDDIVNANIESGRDEFDTDVAPVKSKKVEKEIIPEIAPEPKEKPKEKLDKYNCIMQIIGNNQDYQKEIDEVKTLQKNYKIKDILQGTKEKGNAEQKDRKFLVYATHEETIKLITDKLDAKKIKWEMLNGSVSHIHDIVTRYWLPNSDPQSFTVLMLKGPMYCAGLNLQCITDIIFAHKIEDKNVEIQVIGRAARYGRTTDLALHYVLYNNEYVDTFGRFGR